jgi:DNA-binding Lrp family transcriptional regulator
MERFIAPRNVAGLARRQNHNLYAVDFDSLVDAHNLLGLSREEIVRRLPALRGQGPVPRFAAPLNERNPELAPAPV